MKTKRLLLTLACLALPFMSGCAVWNGFNNIGLARATERGDVKAQIDLRMHYLYAGRVPEDMAKSVDWNRKSANAGGTTGQLYLGLRYLIGYGVDQDMEEAVKWIRKAAEQGHGGAQWHLAWCYRNGEGIAQNEEEAVKWFRKASRQGIRSPDDIFKETRWLMRIQK